MDEKMRMIEKYEGKMSLTNIAREFGVAISTVACIVKDKQRIRKASRGTTELKMTIITKKREGPISEMEKLLARWIRDCVDKDIALTLKQIQGKALSFHEDMKRELGMEGGQFRASRGWFRGFKKRHNLTEHVMISNDAASAAPEMDEEYPDLISEIIKEDNEVAAAQSLEFEGEADNIQELINLQEEETTNEELTELDKIIQEATAADDPPEEGKMFTVEGLQEVFDMLDSAVVKLEAMEPCLDRLEEFKSRVKDASAVYRTIHEEKQRDTFDFT